MKRISDNAYDRVVAKFASHSLLKRAVDSRSLFSATRSGSDCRIAGMCLLEAALAAAASGICPTEATVTLLFDEEVTEAYMREFVKYLDALAKRCNLMFSKMDLRTVAKGGLGQDLAVASVTVTGENTANAKAKAERFARKVKVEDLRKALKENSADYSLVLVGLPALEATVVLRDANAKELEASYPKHFLDTTELEKSLCETKTGLLVELVKAYAETETFVYPVAEHGVFGALWEMAELLGCGLSVDLKEIKIEPLTVEICETLDLSPYEAVSGGAVLVVTKEPEKVLEKSAGAGVVARIIGGLNGGSDRVVINEDEKRFLEKFK